MSELMKVFVDALMGNVVGLIENMLDKRPMILLRFFRQMAKDGRRGQPVQESRAGKRIQHKISEPDIRALRVPHRKFFKSVNVHGALKMMPTQDVGHGLRKLDKLWLAESGNRHLAVSSKR